MTPAMIARAKRNASIDKKKSFAEFYRVMGSGGKFAISGITSDATCGKPDLGLQSVTVTGRK